MRIATGGGAVVIDTVFTNPNGLPDFYWPGEILGKNVASGTYVYEITLSNKCGAVQQSDGFTVLNGIYDTVAAWVDTTALWSEVPTPCCLRTLTLQNLEIVGDVSYIVKDTIWVRDGVTAADSSNILIQAGQVVELDSVEFDGTVSTVEILEAPCQSCRLAPPSSGGTAPDPAMIGTHGVVTASRPKPKPETSVRSSQVSDHQLVQSADDPGSQPSPDYEIGVWAYPNPFANSVTVEVELSRPGPISLIVYDSGMREVSRVIKGRELPAGIHTYTADLSDHPAGLYFVQLVGEGQTITEKIVKQ
ncbi:MAG: T9SS type A sorting domain-containing protein [Bacteroidota bacterium]